MPAIERDRHFTVKAFAAELKCSAATVRQLIRRGELSAFRLGRRSLRIPDFALDDFRRRNSVAGTPPQVPERSRSVVGSDHRLAVAELRDAGFDIQ
jgi:excisionase family DNA binding protein